MKDKKCLFIILSFALLLLFGCANVNPAPNNTTASLNPQFYEGQKASSQMLLPDGTKPVACAFVFGTIPKGFAFDNCTLEGTAPLLASGSTESILPETFTISMNSSEGKTTTAQVQITITANPIQITFTVPGRCRVNASCDINLIARVSGGTPPYHFQSDTFRNGAPPMGMIVDVNGHLVGTPSRAGEYSFGVCAVDSVSRSQCDQTLVRVENPTENGKRTPAGTTKTDPGTKTGNTIRCPSDYLLGSDNLCHEQCGKGYCTGDSQCFGDQCLTCSPSFYLAIDGKCYPYGGNLTCLDGYVLGDDSLCHEQCGKGYCTGDSQCFDNQCLTCSPGFYLAIDGQCYAESGNITCPGGDVYGTDDLCHPECGSGMYCTGDSQCYNGQCLSCDAGQYLGIDGNCYPEHPDDVTCPKDQVYGTDALCHPECGSGTYCTGDAECYNGQCMSCSSGEYLGTDGRCHSENPCNAGYVYGNDNLCHPECGYNTYCTGDAICYNGECMSCGSGEYLGTDGRCHVENPCNSGYIYGDDGWCHPACGYNTYCTGDSICYNGQCLSCGSGEYLGTDGRCYEY